MEATVPLGVAGISVGVGDHVCAFYRTPAGRDEVLLPFLGSGIEAGDKCIAVLDEADTDEVLAALSDEHDVDLALTNRQLEILRSEESYLADGGFVESAMLEFWDVALDTCLGSGEYAFARCLGEMTWALRQSPGVDDLVVYEAKLNQNLREYAQVIVCLYDLDRFDGRVIVDVLRTHPKLLLAGTILDNPYYLEPEEFLATRTSAVAAG